MNFAEFHPLLASTIAGLATEYGRKGHWYGASREDFEQEMHAWLLEHEKKVGEMFATDTEQAARYAAKVLRNECKDHLAAVRSQATGDRKDEQWTYGRDELKTLLQLMFEGVDPEDATPSVTDSLIDVERAYGQLDGEDKDILSAFHAEGYSNKLLAEVHDISEANMSYRHNRAVRRLQRILGGPDQPRGRDPWKGRSAITNSSARAYQANQYDEGVSA